MSDQGFKIGPVLADRMISVVKRVEASPYKYGTSHIPTRFEDMPSSRGGGIKICTFTGSWSVGATKEVTVKESTETLGATNLFFNVGVDCGSRDCAVAQFGGAWYLIAYNCT